MIENELSLDKDQKDSSLDEWNDFIRNPLANKERIISLIPKEIKELDTFNDDDSINTIKSLAELLGRFLTFKKGNDLKFIKEG